MKKETKQKIHRRFGRTPTKGELEAEAKRFLKTLALDKEKILEEGVLFVDYADLEKFSEDLARRLLNFPEEILDILEFALDKEVKGSRARIRFRGMPESIIIPIENLRAKHLKKLVAIKGYLVQASDVRPQVATAKFECPNCGTIISVLQVEKIFREPSKCSCGRTGKFRLISKEMVDCQRLVVSEGRAMEKVEDGLIVPKKPSLSIFIQEDLTDPENKILKHIGRKIKAFGILKEVPVHRDDGSISTRFDIALEGHNLDFKK